MPTSASSDQAWEPVLAFWFAPGMADRWFVKDAAFDAEVREGLGSLHEAATAGQCDDWIEDPRGSLALCILLDQVPRNLYRDDARAYASDAAALRVAKESIERGHDNKLSQVERLFLYMPFEHSETLADQETCVRLTAALDENPEWLDYAVRHRDLIARFGRFPHRNACLGRDNTAEEEDYLAKPGAGF